MPLDGKEMVIHISCQLARAPGKLVSAAKVRRPDRQLPDHFTAHNPPPNRHGCAPAGTSRRPACRTGITLRARRGDASSGASAQLPGPTARILMTPCGPPRDPPEGGGLNR
jgi:hypothetical protein